MLQNFSGYAGDDFQQKFSISGSLSGAVVFWSLYEQLFGVPSGSPILVKTSQSGGGIEIVDSPASSFTISFASADTAALQGNYYHEARILDVDGNVITEVQGILTVNATEPVP
jgi:hypothetical protein